MRTTVREELDIGVGEYVSSGRGIGGRTKTVPEDFVVSEILMDDSKKLILKKGSGGYPLYVLGKWNLGTLEAREKVQWATGIAMNSLGLKDKRALTYQFLSGRKRAEGAVDVVDGAEFRASLVAETVRPLKMVDLLGNFFSIRIHSSGGGEAEATRLGELLGEGRIPNYFGSQRFGRDRPNQLVGRAIVRKKFSEAAAILLDVELSESDSIQALRKVPIRLRRLIVQSYQSYIFNLSLTKLVQRAGRIPAEAGVYIMKHVTSPRVLERYHRDPSEAPPGYVAVPLAQLPGFAFRDRHDEYSKAMVEVLADEGVSPRDFFIQEMQELSVEGGYRPASMVGWYKGWIGGEPAEVRFGLYSGCYATVFLRELMKPTEPSSSGL